MRRHFWVLTAILIVCIAVAAILGTRFREGFAATPTPPTLSTPVAQKLLLQKMAKDFVFENGKLCLTEDQAHKLLFDPYVIIRGKMVNERHDGFAMRPDVPDTTAKNANYLLLGPKSMVRIYDQKNFNGTEWKVENTTYNQKRYAIPRSHKGKVASMHLFRAK